MSTNVFAVKAALRDMIKALPELAGYQVTWGYPTRSPERRWVFVGEVFWPEAMWATNRSREEVFEVAVIVNCQLSAGTAEEVELELQRMAAGIEDGMKANPSLGNPKVVTSDFVPKKLVSFPGDQVYEGQFESVVRVKARL
ncbi:hypothetical protein [Streptomyces sp. NBC_01751]|uniref:hypothetical protein n=1 Tax=Streptomyces sp. NBC_01751 TaxID=2975929 RepID=UPI002DDB9282|nr:hypothetical protein [Streptomyces sp. NBC_01751]WSD23385.1 hypothetical protein OHA26_07775 [Streptomyces sp. NBC_01751]